jgi:Mn-containing catalase
MMNGEQFPASEMLTANLVETLQDLLHAEGQLIKALPKMASAARSPGLQQAFEQHLAETETHVDRLKQVFEQIGMKAKSKACKGMAGLIEEGEEVIDESSEKDDAASDLALIAAAQKVEHYEMSAYLSARALASQAGHSEASQLLNQTLLEEERADKLLNRIATQLMERAGQRSSEADTTVGPDGGEAKETKRTRSRRS